MNKQEVLVVACRLIALWMLITALNMLLLVLSQNLGIFQIHSDEGNYNYTNAIAVLVQIIFTMFLAFGFWMFSPRIAIWILPHPDNQSAYYPNLVGWLTIFYALLGLFWFAQMVPLIVSHTQTVIFSLYFKQDFIFRSRMTSMGFIVGPIAYIVQLSCALLLIIKARWLAIKILRYNGFSES